MMVLCGNMEFGEFSVAGGTPLPAVLVHRLRSVLDVAGEFDPEKLLDQYDAYCTPEVSGAEVFYSAAAVAELCSVLGELLGAVQNHSMSDDPDVKEETARAAAALSMFSVVG